MNWYRKSIKKTAPATKMMVAPEVKLNRKASQRPHSVKAMLSSPDQNIMAINDLVYFSTM